MSKTTLPRRTFLVGTGLAAATALCGTTLGHSAGPERKLHISINGWSIGTVRARDTKTPKPSPDEEYAQLAAAGLNGVEPALGGGEQAASVAAELKKHGLEMRSIYTGSALDNPASVDKEVARFVALAKRAKEVGTRIIVTNPSPLPNRQGKSDEQLKVQAAGLNQVGHALAELGVMLAYHTHDVELQFAAREFHHMLQATDARAMSLCLDCHWVYRGSGNSQVALFDVVKLYGTRIAELHLRQSTGNVWSEAFGDGDIDYRALVKQLAALKVKPLLVLEQGPEGKTPQTLSAAEIHGRSVSYVREVFAELG